MIDRHHGLSISRQAKALKISRGSVYYLPRPVALSASRDHWLARDTAAVVRQ